MAFFNFDRRIISPLKKPWGFKYLIELIKTITTQSDWQEGTLTGVEADSGDYLRLAEQYALEFDGTDDYVNITNQLLDSPSKVTIEAWYKKPELTSDYECLIHCGPDNTIGDSRYWLGVTNSDYITATIGANNGGHSDGETSIKPNTDQWYHVAAVWDGSTVYVYVDGVEEVTYSLSSYDTISDRTTFGSVKDSRLFFNGSGSDIRIWDTARTQQEIQENMHKRLTGDEEGLVGYWPMNEGSGTTVYDESTNNNDGTIHGATWTTSYLFGNRTQQFDLSKVGTVGSSKISWVETLNSQNITIETRLSTDSGETWTSWAEATNGNPIPDLSEGTDVSNGLLECRQTLSTSDPDTTPELDELKIEVYS